VCRHAGNVVEFGGDGMMAVFGAPEGLRDKERVAVDAGYEISSTVPSLAGPAAEPFRVGTGIATGPAAVANVRATDRLWTAARQRVIGRKPVAVDQRRHPGAWWSPVRIP
jgi:class 3 adenylate cyclase